MDYFSEATDASLCALIFLHIFHLYIHIYIYTYSFYTLFFLFAKSDFFQFLFLFFFFTLAGSVFQKELVIVFYNQKSVYIDEERKKKKVS